MDPDYKTSRKAVAWEWPWHIRRDRQTDRRTEEGDSHFLQLLCQLFELGSQNKEQLFFSTALTGGFSCCMRTNSI